MQTVWRAVLCTALFFFSHTPAAYAQDVTLISPDDAVEVSGTLLGFDGEFYRLDTIYGELTVDGSGVRCEGPGCPNLQDFVAEVTFSGSSTMGRVLVPALIKGFAQRERYSVETSETAGGVTTFGLTEQSSGKLRAKFIMRVHTTEEGFADLLTNEADVVMALREIRSEELQRAEDAGMGDLSGPHRSRVLALDAMVPIVAPNGPLRHISSLTLANVMSGKFTRWSELGGPDAPIAVHVPSNATGLGQAVEDQILAPTIARLLPDAIRHNEPEALLDAVVSDPFAIGIASHSDIGNAQVLTLKGSCGFALDASRRTIKTEDYPLTAPMFLYLPARRLPKMARQFLAFTRGPSAQIVIRRAGFVDQSPEEIEIEDQGNRLANAISSAGNEVPLNELQRMIAALTERARLTLSFRFEPGSVRLDAQSRSNVQQLAQALEAGTYDGREMTFVGFSDGDGPAEPNRAIALRRAAAVKQAVESAAETANFDRVDMVTDAFGEALPMACDDSAWGRRVNRRVEVWVR
ncbi:MAG: substrate-binding domain-containing protein [Paracoccaceae bacterium]